MNFKAIVIRFLLTAIVVGAFVACQQEPEPDLSELVESSITPKLESTQEPSTATIARASPTSSAVTPEPTLTVVQPETPTLLPDDQESTSFSVLNYDKESTPQTEPSQIEQTSTPELATEPEVTITPTSTSSSEREVDAHAIIDWQKLDLPDTFSAIYPESFGIENGAFAQKFTDSNGDLFTVPIENSFVFMDDLELSFIFGYTYILTDQYLRQAFIAKVIGDPSLDGQYLSPTVIDVPDVGEASGGYSALLSAEERIDSVDFLIDDVAAAVSIRYPEGQPSPVDVVKLAQVYADSLLDPEPRCEFVSITPVGDSLWPAYEFEASGFFPREQRIVELFGTIGDGEDPLTASNSLLGQTGETSDSEGIVRETIDLGIFLDDGGKIPASELVLTVMGGFSGCEVSEKLSWPESDAIYGEVIENESSPAPVATDDSTGQTEEHILFESDAEESQGIQSLNLQTGEVESLSHHPFTRDWMPELSPGGDALLFTTEADVVSPEIYLLKSDGSFTRLTDNLAMDVHAVWSPDGKEIAFSSDISGNLDVSLMDLESGEISQLTQYEGVDWFPSWSPDGQQLAFESDRDGNFEIYIMDRDGSNLVRLTENEAIDSSPAWSPDGQMIAFNSDRSGVFQIYLMDLITRDTVKLTRGQQQASHPAWSPCGLFIAFDSVVNETSDIYTMKADGSEIRQMTDDPANERYPSWVSQRAEFEAKPYWHKPFCAIDTDGDYVADTYSETWSLDDEVHFMVLMFRNMEDGKEWSHTWTNLSTGISSVTSATWDGGEAGAKTIFGSIPIQEPAIWEIEFRLEEELMQVIQCPVVE